MDNSHEVASALQQIQDEMDSIMQVIEESSPKEKTDIQSRYGALKQRLIASAKAGTVTGEKQPLTESEEFFYQPALEGAERRLKARSNGSTPDIFRSLDDARVDIATMLSQVQDSS